ncbi:cation:proton antiporter [Pseudarthrobacter sp. NIBRBAC000502772]|uniref:cation:proton antiporter n=1 Tax=Pseudarthrobacter sp. NIBRBAC000502772 TaxID=2590775 RepID=UPI001FEE1072|nr:cation:proton antiporter [Pseudarthrobacter sp. NIBRBAC000502772]
MLGPSLLGWIQPVQFTDTLADFGLAMLFFVAGNEIDFALIRGRPANRASAGWVNSGGRHWRWPTPGPHTGGCRDHRSSLMLHSPGSLLPILRDAGESKSPIGIAVTALGAVGEFGPLVAISLFFSGRQLGPATAVLLGFVLLTGLAIYLASRARFPGHQDPPHQRPVRRPVRHLHPHCARCAQHGPGTRYAAGCIRRRRRWKWRTTAAAATARIPPELSAESPGRGS